MFLVLIRRLSSDQDVDLNTAKKVQSELLFLWEAGGC
jgi:hypothetical protein